MSPAAHFMWPYVRRQWKALAGAGGATGVLTAADLAKPWPLAIVVDQLLGQTAPFALDGGDWRMLAGVAVLVLVIALAEAGATYLSNLWLQTAGERISHELRVRVYDHLQALSLAFHQRRAKGDLLTRVTGDVNAMGDLARESAPADSPAGRFPAMLGWPGHGLDLVWSSAGRRSRRISSHSSRQVPRPPSRSIAGRVGSKFGSRPISRPSTVASSRSGSSTRSAPSRSSRCARRSCSSSSRVTYGTTSAGTPARTISSAVL